MPLVVPALVAGLCLSAAVRAEGVASIPPPPPPPGGPSSFPPPPPPIALPTLQEAPRVEGISWELDATVLGSYYTIHPTTPIFISTSAGKFAAFLDSNGDRAGGTFELTRFIDPVVDDGAPRSLQPFLQHASTVYGGFDAGGFVTRPPLVGTSLVTNRTDKSFGVGLGVDVYVTPWLAYTVGAGYTYDVLHDVGIDDATHGFNAAGGVGLRVADARFDLSYAFAATRMNGSFVPPQWGALRLSVLAVFVRRFTLSAWGQTVERGGEGGGELGWYATQNLGFFLGGSGERGRLFTGDDVIANRFTGDASLSWWVAPRVRLSAAYTFTYTEDPDHTADDGSSDGYDEMEHAVTIGAALRFP